MNKTTIYGLGAKLHDGGGHGDPGVDFLAIRPIGFYGLGDYPPLFTTREAAAEYLNTLDTWPGGLVIIELELWIDAK